MFQTADLVKFAKHNPQMNENDANLINAIDFINETKQPEEENQKPQPTEITIIEKRSLRDKAIVNLWNRNFVSRTDRYFYIYRSTVIQSFCIKRMYNLILNSKLLNRK